MASAGIHQKQIERIKAKLIEAKCKDFKLEYFGAASHKYEIGAPLSAGDISNFDQKHAIVLPEDLRAFLINIGHGGHSETAAAAGPAYGLYRLTREKVAYGGSTSLQSKPMIAPVVTDADWQELRRPLDEIDDTLPDEEYDRQYDEAFARLHGGVMTIGFRGCEVYSAMLISGPDKGRVIYLDIDGHRPIFAPEENFLDWYEQWLDDVLAEGLNNAH